VGVAKYGGVAKSVGVVTGGLLGRFQRSIIHTRTYVNGPFALLLGTFQDVAAVTK